MKKDRKGTEIENLRDYILLNSDRETTDKIMSMIDKVIRKRERTLLRELRNSFMDDGSNGLFILGRINGMLK